MSVFKNMQRELQGWLEQEHPQRKMLFLSGPRQTGKSTLAQQTLAERGVGTYFNWDQPADRKRILAYDVTPPQGAKRPLIVFDEIHKLRRFKGFLKGYFDQYADVADIWVTGSGRLDLYQRGGDSLLGRYFPYHMHPLTVGEASATSPRSLDSIAPDAFWAGVQAGPPAIGRASLDVLRTVSGFPEPFLKNTASFYRRWSNTRRARVTHEDIRDLTRIADLDRLEFLISLLAPRVGSPLSVNSLREDLEVAFETVKAWIAALERTFYVYALSPYSKRIERALKKERKLYLWDWAEVPTPAARFENLVVSHFLKACHMWTDFGFGNFSLHYLRDKQKREVDICICNDRKPWLVCEVKSTDAEPSPALAYFADAIGCERRLQIVQATGVMRRLPNKAGDIYVGAADRILPLLP